MANHVDFIDDYCGYKIFKESMEDSGGEKQPKKAGGSGCSAWGAIIVIVLAVLSIFDSFRKSSSKSYSSGYCYGSSKSRTSTFDPCNARSYTNPDNFYYDNYNDLWDYEDSKNY